MCRSALFDLHTSLSCTTLGWLSCFSTRISRNAVIGKP